jgi:DNA processing protein
VLVLTPGDERFPPLLHEIFAPPPVLFVKGNLDVFSRHAVGIVGTRHPTPYGIRAAGAISRELAQAGIAVVSGLALGIDTAAHQACLEAGGCTIAVLGCGVDVIYPPSNHALADRITEQGAIVSEFALGTKPLGHHFPRRNRIISGLSAGVLVVEAGEKSGALITANFALQQGREVFALPGPVFSDKSAGTFNLIKSGATPVRSGADILESIQTVRLNSVANQRVSFPFAEDLLSTEERSLLGHLGDAPLRVDELAGASGLPVSALLDALLNLELKGAVRQLAGQQFVRMGS